jgi:hypothetical protein
MSYVINNISYELCQVNVINYELYQVNVINYELMTMTIWMAMSCYVND